MKIALLSSDIALLERWKKLLPLYKTNVLEDFENVWDLRDSLLILSSDACSANHHLFVNTLLKNSNKILVLDRVPEFIKAKNWLSYGVHGYGNAIMTTSYINSAVESIINHHIWILPQITMQLLQSVINPQNDNSETLFEVLTAKEKEIAEFLKKGYSNSAIVLELSVSINTVKAHIKNIYKKLDVNDRIAFSLLLAK